MNSSKIVNMVGSGDIEREVDLDAVLQAANEEDNQIQISKNQQGLKINFPTTSGTIVLYRSGKYVIMGSESEEEFYSISNSFLELCLNLGVISNTGNTSLEVTNYVYSVGIDKNINLSQLNIMLGDEAEYEPEQFPFVVFRPKDMDCTVTISSSGKCVINTPNGDEEVERVLERLNSTIEKYTFE